MPVATAVTPPPEYDVKEANTHALLEETPGHAYHHTGNAHFASRHQQVCRDPSPLILVSCKRNRMIEVEKT
jgi:hypothetical protein